MRTVFITGGRGFIGRNLGESLEQSGYQVLAPSSNELNLLDEKAVDAFMRRQPVDIIVHAANKGGGATRWRCGMLFIQIFGCF